MYNTSRALIRLVPEPFGKVGASSGRHRPCRGQDVLEQSSTANQHGAWISCARRALRLQCIPRHTARMTSVSTPSSASVQEALKRMSLLRDNDFTAKAVRDMIAEVEGRKPRKKKPTPQTTIVYNTVYNSGDDQLGNSSAQRHFDTIITSVLSDNSSVAPTRCGRSDGGRGPVKTLSGRLARKLQRSASLVNAGLSKQIQTVLDAATVDRCDFVEICCSDVPCLTEPMQRRGLSSSSLLRSDGVGHAAVFDPDSFFDNFLCMLQQF